MDDGAGPGWPGGEAYGAGGWSGGVPVGGEAACALCGRAAPGLTRHHLLPRSRSRKAKRRLRGDARRAVVAQQHETVLLCRPCHGTVHATLSERALEREYGTLDALRAHPEIARFVAWVRKQHPSRRITVRRGPRGAAR